MATSYFSVWRKRETAAVTAATACGLGGPAPQTAVDYYEDRGILSSYDIFHFGEGLLGVKNFPLAVAEVCLAACQRYSFHFLARWQGCRLQNLSEGCLPVLSTVSACQIDSPDFF